MATVWYVQGAEPEQPWPILWATKELAERYARAMFPDESPDTRYARIMCRNIEEE